MVKTTENEDTTTYFDILKVRQLKLDSLDSLSGTAVSLTADLLPYQDNTYKIGNDLYRFSKVYNIRNYVPGNDAGTTFQSTNTITLVTATPAFVPLTIGSPIYDAPGPYNWKLPHRGFYIMTFNIEYNTGGTSNPISIEIYNVTYSQLQQYYVTDGNTKLTSIAALAFWCNDANEEYALQASSLNNDVTNFNITTGRLMCASSFE